ncbi:MAG: hypothetical protein CEE43_14450 [Promethearchaeota archaeon Loki_b32]|nr:MAG: hypothetical protein CEE43_14450 [Candidatus Lokiarchaeota archaeon Loki_b32]
MSQLTKYLNIFSKEIEEIKLRKDNRKFELKKIGSRSFLTNSTFEKEDFCFLCQYNQNIIEVYYNPLKINKEYLNVPNITDETLEDIFKYLAHHEYGHSLLNESTKKSFNVLNKRVITTKSKRNIILKTIIFIFREFFADWQAKMTGSNIPNFYLDQVFQNIEEVFTLIKFLKFPNSTISLNDLILLFYYKFLYPSVYYHVFNRWDYLMEKCGRFKDLELINIVSKINYFFEDLIKSTSDIYVYKKALLELASLLKNIDYFELFLKNNLKDQTNLKFNNILDLL